MMLSTSFKGPRAGFLCVDASPRRRGYGTARGRRERLGLSCACCPPAPGKSPRNRPGRPARLPGSRPGPRPRAREHRSGRRALPRPRTQSFRLLLISGASRSQARSIFKYAWWISPEINSRRCRCTFSRLLAAIRGSLIGPRRAVSYLWSGRCCNFHGFALCCIKYDESRMLSVRHSRPSIVKIQLQGFIRLAPMWLTSPS